MRLPKHRLFDYTTPGRGIPEDEPKKTGIKLFFDILIRRFWKMVSLNALYIAFSVPGLIVMWFITYILLTLVCAPLINGDENFAKGVTQLCFYLTCVIYAVFGGGAPTAAMTYVLRNYREDRHAWVWSDFKDKLRENFRQGTVTYIIDCALLFVLGVNYWFYSMYAQTNAAAFILQGLMAVIFFVFLLMHAYIYPIMISFDMKLTQIYKNSFLLALGKLPTTFLSMLVCVLFCAGTAYLAFFVTIYAMLLIPIIMFAFSAYVNLFITYPVVKRYLAKKEGESDENEA